MGSMPECQFIKYMTIKIPIKINHFYIIYQTYTKELHKLDIDVTIIIPSTIKWNLSASKSMTKPILVLLIFKLY